MGLYWCLVRLCLAVLYVLFYMLMINKKDILRFGLVECLHNFFSSLGLLLFLFENLKCEYCRMNLYETLIAVTLLVVDAIYAAHMQFHFSFML